MRHFRPPYSKFDFALPSHPFVTHHSAPPVTIPVYILWSCGRKAVVVCWTKGTVRFLRFESICRSEVSYEAQFFTFLHIPIHTFHSFRFGGCLSEPLCHVWIAIL